MLLVIKLDNNFNVNYPSGKFLFVNVNKSLANLFLKTELITGKRKYMPVLAFPLNIIQDPRKHREDII